MDSVFQIDRYNWSLEPNDFYLCDISYKPCLPNRRYVDYFFITDSNDCRYEVLIRGNSIGIIYENKFFLLKDPLT